MDTKKSSIFNINANLIVLISYLGGLVLKWLPIACYFAWIIPLILYLSESKNEFVKKQTSQATLLYFFSSIVSIIVYIFLLIFAPTETSDIYNMIVTGSLFLVGVISICTTIISIAITIFALTATIKVYSYEDYNIPYLSKYLDKFRKYLEVIEGKTKIKKEQKHNSNEYNNNEEEIKENKKKKIKPHKIRKRKDTEN